MRACASMLAVTLVGSMIAIAPESLAEDDYQLISIGNREQPANDHSSFGQLSRTGRFVLFDSLGENLSNRDQPGPHQDVYLRDRRKGTTRLVSLSSRERPAKAGWGPSISPNGRYVAFCSTDPRLVRPDSFEFQISHWHPDTDVFVRDLRTGVTRRATTSWRGREANNWSCSASVADTGDVAFSSYASNLVRRDRNRLEDVFLYDWSSRNVRRVSRGPAGAADAHISGNGRLVLYYTGGAQVRGDTNRLAEPYLFRRGDGRYLRVARRAGGGQISSGGCDQVGMDISYTGRFVLATCRDGRMANPQIADKTSHLWRIDRRTGRNVLVNRTTSDYSAPWGAAVSDDGRRVVFAMRGGAVGGTPFDDRDNVYLWRAGRGVTNLTPGPLAWWWNFTQDISGDGRFALFSSDAHAMSSRDLNDPQQVDLFLERLP